MIIYTFIDYISVENLVCSSTYIMVINVPCLSSAYKHKNITNYLDKKRFLEIFNLSILLGTFCNAHHIIQ